MDLVETLLIQAEYIEYPYKCMGNMVNFQRNWHPW